MDARAIFEAIKDLEPFARQKSLERYVGSDAPLRLEVERFLEEFDAQPLSIEQLQTGESASTSLNPTAVEDEYETLAQGTDSQTVLLAGRYKLLAPIGEGGMGAVWLAEQKEPIKRRVAIKLIKAGMDSAQVLARFDAERQALALMDHPNIARVFDGGLTPERRPFFVMELVKGTPITEYSDRNSLSIRERLTLFTQVCEAIQHAHQKGIIHRDLKPSNILVAEIDGNRAVKVIDFGLAKAMHGAHTLTDLTMNTVQGVVVGTPLYMAPEQIHSNSFDIDTRVDVYSLGVVLYELLTGATPIDRERVKKAAWDEFRKMVVDEDPIKPSSRISTSDTLRDIAKARHVDAGKLASIVRGELDWIILKALEKERRRRYESASDFSADIRRYLNGDAVQAAPPSRFYQIRKFVSRHRIAVSVSAVVLVTLIVGIVGTSYGLALANRAASRERKAREAAQANRQEAIAAVRQFAEVIASNEPLKRHGDLSELRKSLLNSPLRFLQNLKSELVVENTETEQDLKELSDAATLVAKLTAELGNQKEGILLYQEAIDTLERSLSTGAGNFESFVKLVDCELELGRLLGTTDEVDEAIRIYQRTLARLADSDFKKPSEVERLSFARARALLGIADKYVTQTKDTLASEHYRAALEELKKSKSRSPEGIEQYQLQMEVMYETAYFALDNSRYAEAEKTLREAIQLSEKLSQNGEVDLKIQRLTADCYEALAFVLQDTGQVVRSREPMEKAKEIYERILQNNPSSVEDAVQVSGVLHNLGVQLSIEGKLSAALELFAQAKEINEALLVQSPDNAKVASFLEANRAQIAATYGVVGRYSEAIVEMSLLIDAATDAIDGGVASVEMLSDQAGNLHNVAVVQRSTGKFEEATENLRKAVALDQEALKMRPDDSVARIQLQKHAIALVEIGNQRRSPQLIAEGKKLSVQLASIDPDVSRWNDALQAGIGISEVPIDELEAGAKAAVACRAFATGADLYLELANRDPNWKSTPENWNALVNASVAAGTNQSLERQLRAYPKTPANRKVIQANDSCNMLR